jgi:aminoglycoside N3'-acetyltransferase
MESIINLDNRNILAFENIKINNAKTMKRRKNIQTKYELRQRNNLAFEKIMKWTNNERKGFSSKNMHKKTVEKAHSRIVRKKPYSYFKHIPMK